MFLISENLNDKFLNLLGTPIAHIITIIILCRWSHFKNTTLKWKAHHLILTPFVIILLIGTLCISSELSSSIPRYEIFLQSYLDKIDQLDNISLIVNGIIISPICEEFLFRGIISKGFFKKYGKNKAIFYSAFLFSLSHLEPIQLLNAFFAGIVLSWIYLTTKNLWLPIIAHIFNNLLASMNGIDLLTSYLINDFMYFLFFIGVCLITYSSYSNIKKRVSIFN